MQPRVWISANRLCMGESHRDCEGKPIEGFTLTFQRLLHQSCALYLWTRMYNSKIICSFPLPILPSLQQFVTWLFRYEDLLHTILLLWLPQESLTKTHFVHYGRYRIYTTSQEKNFLPEEIMWSRQTSRIQIKKNVATESLCLGFFLSVLWLLCLIVTFQINTLRLLLDVNVEKKGKLVPRNNHLSL